MDGEAEGADRLDSVLGEVAATQTGGQVRREPAAGREVRRVVLLDHTDGRGQEHEVLVLEDDGTVRVLGHDRGERVSSYFGRGITSYEWMYVLPPERVGNLVAAMGGDTDDDVLDLLAGHYQRTQGRLSDLLRRPEVAAEFSNWHS
jgi:hypothetical protein